MTGSHRREPHSRPVASVGSHRAPRAKSPHLWKMLLSAAAVLTLAVVAVVVVPRGQEAADPAPADTSTALDPVGTTPNSAPSPAPLSPPNRRQAPEVVPTSPPEPVKRPERALPEGGSGEFVAATGRSETVGSGGLVTYQVEVEREVPLRPQQIATTVDRTLLDPRGWTASGAHTLARVESGADVRVLLATPETTDSLCAPLETQGRLSCRNGPLVVLNAWRWINGADAYAGDLPNYRRYLISHEVGHALGNAHQECPAPGAMAPVMMQQTKGIGECLANPWPTPSQ